MIPTISPPPHLPQQPRLRTQVNPLQHRLLPPLVPCAYPLRLSTAIQHLVGWRTPLRTVKAGNYTTFKAYHIASAPMYLVVRH